MLQADRSPGEGEQPWGAISGPERIAEVSSALRPVGNPVRRVGASAGWQMQVPRKRLEFHTVIAVAIVFGSRVGAVAAREGDAA